MKNVVDRFIQEKAHIVGGLKLFLPQDAKHVVHLLIEQGKKILGIDGIFVNQEGHRPSMEDTLLTYKLYDKGLSEYEIEEKISNFIDERSNKNNLLFELVF